jgi:hypothetical protein
MTPTEEDKEYAKRVLGMGRLKLLEGLSDECDPETISLDLLMRQANAREGLEELALEMRMDVLVVGTRGFGMMKRLVLGSVADYLVHHAPCDVLVVKLPEQEQAVVTEEQQQQRRQLMDSRDMYVARRQMLSLTDQSGSNNSATNMDTAATSMDTAGAESKKDA